MAALTIPGVGERIGRRYQRVVSIGVTGESADVDLATTTTTNILINVNEPNVMVHKLERQVVVAFDTTVITVGDSDDADGFWTDTIFGHTTAAVFDVDTAGAYEAGRLYTSSQVINLTIGTAAPTTGKALFRVEYSRGVDTDITPATSS